MPRASTFIVSLAAWLLVLGGTQAAFADDTTDISNIGFVLYTKSHSPGTLNARWMFTTEYGGPGLATGGPRDGFAGKYHVRYFLENGEFSDEYDLVIKKSGDTYQAKWLVDGRVQAVGVGMEIEGGLAIGWRRVTN